MCKNMLVGRRISFCKGRVYGTLPREAGDYWSLAGPGHLTGSRPLAVAPLYFNFLIFFDFFIGVMKKVVDGPGILGEWVKSSIPHGAWRFKKIPIFFAKIRVHQDLHIQHWDFRLMEK
jgi:hypothetical protein